MIAPYATVCFGGDLVEDQVCRAIRRILGLRAPDVTPASRLIDDLHCESLDLVEIPNAIEELYAVEIGDEEAIACVTVADYVALAIAKLKGAGR